MVGKPASSKTRTSWILAAVIAFFGVSVTPAGAASAQALDPIVNAGWVAFFWGQDGFAGTYSITTERAVRVTITDVNCTGDSFRVLAGDRVQLVTPSVPQIPCDDTATSDPDVALADPAYSHGSFVLTPGTYQLVIEAVDNPFGGGAGFIRFDSPPRRR